MSDFSGEARRRPAIRAGSVYRARLPIAVAGVLLAVLVASDALSALPALIVFVIILAAAAVDLGGGADVAPIPAATVLPALAPGDPLLEAVVAGLPDPVVALDRDGRVLSFNSAASLLAPALRRGEPAAIALRIPDMVEAIRHAGAADEVRRIEFSERVPVDRWYEAIVTPVTRRGTQRSRAADLVVVTFHDLTPLRRVEEMRADFVANASHELRTPLAALSGFIETLQGPAHDDAAARDRFLPIMQAQATRMARLIDDLLSLSRIELNAHRRPETPVDVVPLVRQVADGLQTLARDRGVSISVAPPGRRLLVLGDRDELLRVFENLIENALKYGASGKRVDIAFTQAQPAGGLPEVRVAVRDYGPGIAPEHLPRLTERFYRVDVAESRAQGGTGLGLALVKHILNRHRGKLSITSTPGAGATFTAHLPLASAESGNVTSSPLGSAA